MPVPERIGPYRMLDVLGEGGFGIVYVGEQEEPVRRRVAIKVIKLGMDTAEVIARFEQERQALAVMDHPNVARVLDAGATGAGRPYFVMELVRGEPISAYCDRQQLSTRQRLELFAGDNGFGGDNNLTPLVLQVSEKVGYELTFSASGDFANTSFSQITLVDQFDQVISGSGTLQPGQYRILFDFGLDLGFGERSDIADFTWTLCRRLRRSW